MCLFSNGLLSGCGVWTVGARTALGRLTLKTVLVPVVRSIFTTNRSLNSHDPTPSLQGVPLENNSHLKGTQVPCAHGDDVAVKQSTLIVLLCKKGKLEEALTLYNQMRYKEILASVEAHEALVSGLARLGQIEIACLSKAGHSVEARKFWNEATERGLLLTKTVFTALIEGLVKIGDHMEAYILYMDYKNSGRTPDAAVLDLLIAPLALNGEVDEAYQLLQELTTVACEFGRVLEVTIISWRLLAGQTEQMKLMNCGWK
ncbi:hypothetical protein GOP47_0026516 [Adiantum capillus-veneris]|nr:hypothetical protein GOP47_0026516 [Adiantum capillus-veneris]